MSACSSILREAERLAIVDTNFGKLNADAL